ncbi:MAG: hypothetical protein KDC16_11010 [Saprospiraceae bacterium]|nr:hypothetical protein [Saprospiraceae bacterium]MCB9327926.1 hypothetical protein [Lewinellaceae bacterium]
MDTIEFYNLFAPKRFRRFHCHHFNNEEDGCSHEFYEKYVQGDLKDSKPDFNPLAKAVFYDTKHQYEIYSLAPVLNITRGILIKPELLDFISGYNLAEHCVYKGIKREFQGIVYDDLIFLYFYRDYSLTIDWSNSIYWVLKDGYYNRNEDKESMEDYIIEDNISFESYEEYNTKQIEYYKTDKTKMLQVKNLKCPDVINYDMFGFQGFSAGIFVSQKLRRDLEKRKTKGLDFWKNIYFKFLID